MTIIYGEKFIEAICTEFIDSTTGKAIIKLAKGTKFNPIDCPYKKIELKENEVIDLITCCHSNDGIVKSLIFTTSLNNYWLLEGEKSLSDVSISNEDLERIDEEKNNTQNQRISKRNKSLKIIVENENIDKSLLDINSAKEKRNKIEKSSPMIKRNTSTISGSQSINLKMKGKGLAGFKLTFGEYLENIEIYSIMKENIKTQKSINDI